MLCLQGVEVQVWTWTFPGVGQLGGLDSSAEGRARGDIASAGPAHVSAHGEAHQKHRARLGVGGCLSSHSDQDQGAHKGLRSPVFGQQKIPVFLSPGLCEKGPRVAVIAGESYGA